MSLARLFIFTFIMLPFSAWAGCYSVDACFDVKQNDYTIVAEGYTVRVTGVHLSSDEAWDIFLVKQQDTGFVRGINENDDVHWEERIEIDFDPNEKINPLTFSKVVTRKCKGGACKTLTE